MPSLDEILRTTLPSTPTLPFETASPTTIEQIQQRREGLRTPLQQAEAGKVEAQRVQEAGKLRKIQLEEEAAAKKERGLLEIEAKRPIPKELPEFVPPKQTFDELFSMLMIGIGTGTGAGRGNYMIAANAMIGAMEGYQKGKKEQLNNAIKEFDIAVKRATQEEKINTAKYNQIAANEKIALGEKIRQISLQAKTVDDKVMAAITRTGDFDKVIKEITRRNEGYDKLEQQRIKAEEAVKEHNRRMAESREGRKGTVLVRKPDGTLTKIQEVYKDGELVIPPGFKLIEKAGKGDDDDRTKPTTVDTRAYEALKKEQKLWGRMSQTLSNPEFAKRFDSLGLKKFLFEPLVTNEGILNIVSKAMSAAQTKAIAENDKEMIKFLQDITQVRNTYYLQQSGKAVTGGEAARNFFTTAQPTDSAASLSTKVSRAIEDVETEIQEKEKLFKFPKAATTSAETTTQALPPGIPSGSREIGTTTPDAQGKTKKVYLTPDGKKLTED